MWLYTLRAGPPPDERESFVRWIVILALNPYMTPPNLITYLAEVQVLKLFVAHACD